jgi:LysR family transcriptional regulator, low CO2-responsive transcriptional regulator
MNDLIDTKKLRMFVTTVKEGSMRKASAKLFVTPSALSHGVKALEETLETELLIRSGPKVAPTEMGKLFFNEALDILSRLDAASNRFAGGGGVRQQELRIGLTNTGCSHLFPAIVREFRESCPHVALKLEIADTNLLIQQFEERQIDVAIAPIQREYNEIEQTRIGEDELVYITHPAHPWARAGKLDRTTIGRQQLIIPSVSSNTYNLVDARYRELRLPLTPFIELNNEDTIKQLVSLNMGIGIVPSWIAKDEIESGRLFAFQTPKRPLRRRWTIAHHSSFPKNLSEFLFIGTSKAVAKNIIERIRL